MANEVKKMGFVKFILLIIVPIVAGMIMSGGVGQFIDPPSAFIVIVPTIGTLLVAYKGAFLSSFTAIWKERRDSVFGDKDLLTAIDFWGTVGTCAVGYGCLGFFIGLIAMLGSLDDPSMLGPFLAVGLIAVMYGLIAKYLVAEPIIALLKRKSSS